ncbi:hypothetical protein, partial [Raoultella planticola]|uniref:hypothetical protein n=2 Tax=Raoultella planticola TaxID=575 RepID=UPI001953D8F2
MYMLSRLGYIVDTFFWRSPKRALVKSLRVWPSTVRTGVKMSSRKELANAIRALSMDAVQKAKSGHPGAP